MTQHPDDGPSPKPAVGDPAAGAPPEADRPEGETPSDGGRSAEVTASDGGRPAVVEPETPTSDGTGAEATASEAAAPVAGGGGPTTDAPGGYASDDGPGPAASASGTGRDARAAEDAPAADQAAAATASGDSLFSPSPTWRPAEHRPGVDPYETTRLPVTPAAPDRRFADPAPPVDPSAAAPPRPGGTRVGSALFFDDRLGDTEHTAHPHDAEDTAVDSPVDDAPTEAMAVVEPRGRHRAAAGDDADAAAEWRPPRQTSRLTTVLVIALLVAIGFLAGVFVGRSAAPAPSGEQPRPAATSPARPGALR